MSALHHYTPARGVLTLALNFPHVPWYFCETPEEAELLAFRKLSEFWLKHRKEITPCQT